MTSDNIKEFIDKLQESEYFVDPEKADALYILKHLFPDECEPYLKLIDSLINEYD